MSTLHTALIDYRFRLLPQNKFLEHSNSIKKVKSLKQPGMDEDEIDEIELNPEIFDEED